MAIFFCSQLNDAIIGQMSNVKVTSLEQVTQMAAVVALATEQKDEISTNSEVRLLSIRHVAAVVKYIRFL